MNKTFLKQIGIDVAVSDDTRVDLDIHTKIDDRKV
jgi:hypothetical protein